MPLRTVPTALPPKDISRDAHREWVNSLVPRIDRDGSGDISCQELNCEEFIALVKKLLMPSAEGTGGAQHSRSELNTRQALQFCMRKADVNGDGKLSVQELEAFLWVMRRPTSCSTLSHLAFALFDLDCNLLISKEEFRGLLRVFLGHSPTLVLLEKHWSSMTPIGEEQATEQQFIKWIRKAENDAFSQFRPAAEDAEPGLLSLGRSQDLYERNARSSVFSTSSLRMAPQRSSMATRPKWNKKLGTGPNPGHYNDKMPLGERRYFSKAQSLPELKAFWEAYPETFSAQLRRASESEAPLVQVRKGDKPQPRLGPTSTARRSRGKRLPSSSLEEDHGGIFPFRNTALACVPW